MSNSPLSYSKHRKATLEVKPRQTDNLNDPRYGLQSPMRVHTILHNLYREAGLVEKGSSRRYQLRAHSIRKYFRTQLAALGVNADYIEYMMGYNVSTYHDIGMKGVEFIRNIYASSNLSIKPRTQLSRLDMLKEIIRAWGMDPRENSDQRSLHRATENISLAP